MKKIYPEATKHPISLYGDDDEDAPIETIGDDEDDDLDAISLLEEEKVKPPEIIYGPDQELEFEIPNRKNYEDSDDSTISDENLELKKQNSVKNQKIIVTSLQQQRQEMKDKIVKEVLDLVLPDIDQYDIDGQTNDKNEKYNRLYAEFVKWMKFLGCMELDLHDAVLSGSLGQVRKTLVKLTQGKDANPELINEYDQKGCTAISYAVKIKAIEVVQLLIDYEALPDFVDMQTGRTPLFYSVLNGTHDISKMLLDAGAGPNAVDNQCVSPIMIAASKNDVKHCQLLSGRLADVDIQDENGWTALHYAAYGNAPEAIYFLLDEGANRHLKDINRRKPIHIAKFKNHGNCVAALSTKSKISL